MTELQAAKTCVSTLIRALDGARPDSVAETLSSHLAPDHHWRGLHPFGETNGPEALADTFWCPLLHAFPQLQRREDIFFAGRNSCDDCASVWVCSMGNFLGLFDADWLDIPATGRLTFLRYAEFFEVADGRIVSSALFLDILSVMHQAGVYPLPPPTGAHFMYPGPRTHDGLLRDAQPPGDGTATLDLIERMIGDLDALNQSGNDRAGAGFLATSWHEDMLWYGPFGIGATYTIPRYQHQHTFPFRLGLGDKTFNGHVARFAEGNYGAFFGWPNLTNTSRGGFLGLPGSDRPADMRVVDVYRRDGDRLAENWVFMDVLHYLNMQGLDVLERMRQMHPGATL